MANTISKIVAYRTGWRAEYAALAELVRDALGSAVVALHHIGSTSVPELAAKDVIDLQLTVERLQAYSHERLEAAGFEVNQA